MPGTLTINGTSVTVEADKSFSHGVTLTEGDNAFTLLAVDSDSNTVTQTLSLTLDTIAPMIIITTPADGSVTDQAQQTIKGSVSETATLTINGTTILLSSGEIQTLNYGNVTVDAGDARHQSLTIVLDRDAGTFSVVGEIRMGGDNDFSYDASLFEGENVFVIVATDQAGNSSDVTLTVILDTTP